MFHASYRVGRVFGIPIKVHFTLLLVIPYLLAQLGRADLGVFWGLLTIVGLFTSVALHELGHSFVALHKGIRVRQILLLPIGGVAQLEAVSPRPKDELQIAIAGPIVSVLLFFTLVPIASIFWRLHLVPLATMAYILCIVNFFMAAFNLIPSFPMDGGRIFRAWLTPRVGKLRATYIASRIGKTLAVIFGILGLFYSFLWVLIALFVYFAAGAEYRMVQMEELSRRARYTPWFYSSARSPSDPREVDEEDVYVSPPPFER